MSSPLWRRRGLPAPNRHFHDSCYVYIPPIELKRIRVKANAMACFLSGWLKRPVKVPSLVRFYTGNSAMYYADSNTVVLGAKAIIFGGFSEDIHLIHELLHGYFPDSAGLFNKAGEQKIVSMEAPALKAWYKAIGRLPV